MKQARVILETYHVDGEEHISETELLHGAIKGMVSSLKDPYTRFVYPDELKEEEIELQGEYGGLGIYIGQRDGKTLVVSPIEDTPVSYTHLDVYKRQDLKRSISLKAIADSTPPTRRAPTTAPMKISLARRNIFLIPPFRLHYLPR